MIVLSLHLETHVLLQLRVQPEVVVTTGQVDTSCSYSLTGCVGQPGECLVRHLAMRKLLINWTHVNDESVPPITLWHHKSTDAVLRPVGKLADSAITYILITYRRPRHSCSRFQGTARNMDRSGCSHRFNKNTVFNR